MARGKSPIPRYKRKRSTSSFPVRAIGGIVRIILGLVLLSVLWVLLYRFINPPITVTMISDIIDGRGAEREWMPIERIDRDMVRAVIAGEDSKFCQHDGFDFEAIEAAMQRNASGGRIRGGSTISQQTAKNAFLWQGGGYVRKAVEAWFTVLIEAMWPKWRIMEVYLNVAETGIGTYGVNAGAERYYGHDASAITRQEAARIAAVLPLPKKRGAIAPKGFTRRYGGTIQSRIGVVARDGLDSCVYDEVRAPKDKAPPALTTTRAAPGEEYETVKPPPPVIEDEPQTPEQENAAEFDPAPNEVEDQVDNLISVAPPEVPDPAEENVTNLPL